MRWTSPLFLAVAMAVPGAATSQISVLNDPAAVALATAAGTCGERGVRSAYFDASGAVQARCNDQAVAFWHARQPTSQGGLVPLALGGGMVAALMAASSTNGGTTSDTN